MSEMLSLEVQIYITGTLMLSLCSVVMMLF